ncbi:MAG TPA: hypothetical protein VKM72_10415 [Thermoanaerobaculia bacterium]|nr:hypothetical protein [Thermoanaerobaculia bacterium]
MELQTILKYLGGVILVALILAAVILAVAIRKLRKVRVPPDADFFTAVRAVPFSLVVGLDLLDLGLDSFSAPIIWFILNRTGLQALRNVASFEAFIPFTGPIPTLTLAWLAARYLNLGKPHDPNVIEAERIGPGRYVARPAPPGNR